MVSVVSITYNHESYIRDCLEGFLKQETSFPLEIIIHDDASTDHTADILREYYEKRPDLFYLIIEKENQYYRKDFLVPLFRQAQGKYVALCEGDDYWTDPLKLQKQFDFMESHSECSLCFHSVLQTTEGIKDRNRLKIPSGETSPKKIYPRWAIPTCSIFLKNKVIHEYAKILSKFKGFYSSDVVIFLSASNIGKLWGMEDTMAVYVRHSSGATQKIQEQSIFKHLRHHRAIRKAFPGLTKESYTYSVFLIYRFILKKKMLKLIKLLACYKIRYHLRAYCFYAEELLLRSCINRQRVKNHGLLEKQLNKHT